MFTEANEESEGRNGGGLLYSQGGEIRILLQTACSLLTQHSPLYRALGFVPKSERRSLTRKVKPAAATLVPLPKAA